MTLQKPWGHQQTMMAAGNQRLDRDALSATLETGSLEMITQAARHWGRGLTISRQSIKRWLIVPLAGVD